MVRKIPFLGNQFNECNTYGFLFKTSFWKIPMAILRTESYKNIIYTIDLDGKNISLNVKNYKMFIGPIMSRLTGTENENNNINTFTPILHAFLQ